MCVGKYCIPYVVSELYTFNKPQASMQLPLTVYFDLEINSLLIHLDTEHLVYFAHELLNLDFFLYLLELSILEHVDIQHVIDQIKEELGGISNYPRHFLNFHDLR